MAINGADLGSLSSAAAPVVPLQAEEDAPAASEGLWHDLFEVDAEH